MSDEPSLFSNENEEKVTGLIRKAVLFKDAKGKGFNQEQIDFLRVWSNELFTTGFLMGKQQYENK